MGKTLYVIELSDEQVALLNQIISDSDAPANELLHAKILLGSRADAPQKMTAQELADAIGTSKTTVHNTRKLFADLGFEAALYDRPYPKHYNKELDDEKVINEILALAKETPPTRRKNWSVRRLCEECLARNIIQKISPSAMLKLLQENGISFNECKNRVSSK